MRLPPSRSRTEGRGCHQLGEGTRPSGASLTPASSSSESGGGGEECAGHPAAQASPRLPACSCPLVGALSVPSSASSAPVFHLHLGLPPPCILSHLAVRPLSWAVCQAASKRLTATTVPTSLKCTRGVRRNPVKARTCARTLERAQARRDTGPARVFELMQVRIQSRAQDARSPHVPSSVGRSAHVQAQGAPGLGVPFAQTDVRCRL